MTERIRIGLIGANSHRGWAPLSHLPALAANPEFELTAVCTTRMESAKESAEKFGARLAFDDYNELVVHPEIDLVAVVLRVPSHYDPTMAALRAGKHVFTEWPLGRNTEEAVEMAEAARSRGVKHMVGLQSRANPGIIYLKDLLRDGYVGQVMSCQVSMIRGGILSRPLDRTWQRDVNLGANILTIPFGHTVDALRYIVGDFSDLSAVVSTQARKWRANETNEMLDVTAPDHVLVSGRLENGAVASVHVATIPYAGSGLRLEIYGKEGTLVATASNSPQLAEIRIQGAQGKGRLEALEVPAHYTCPEEDTPAGAAGNVGRMYHRLGKAIRSGGECRPDFDTAVELHRLLDGVRQSAESGCLMKVASADGTSP